MAKKLKYHSPSWEQRKWEFAVTSHQRANQILRTLERHNIGDRQYWENRIAELEQEYPSLRKEHAKA